MRIRSPSSRAKPRIHYSFFDVAAAAVAPLLALYLRDAYILSYDGAVATAIYCLVSFMFSLIAFATFGLRDAMPRYLSVHDAIDIAKAVVVGELMTCIVLFTFTRLEGIPRSTPVIHALILGAALAFVRAVAHLTDRERKPPAPSPHLDREHIILIGLTELSSLYMKVLEALAPGQKRVVAVLDEAPDVIGRSIGGVRVFGPPSHLKSLIDEFAVHGISIVRVVVGGERNLLSDGALDEIERVCTQHEAQLEFVPQLFGLSRLPEQSPAPRAEPEPALQPDADSEFVPPAYFRFKGFGDFFIALVLTVALLPLWILIAFIVLLDLGPPIVFWQQRLGLNGRQFLLYKFRTLRPPFDSEGRRLAPEQRLSWIGRLLRKTRLDELPQLLNVLVGDMSLVGPRPLLLHDQPALPARRLMVRPGITGWAQVNGGTLLSVTEKEALDEWYIRHASPWLDLRIVGMTIVSLLRAEKRSTDAVARARSSRAPTPAAPPSAPPSFLRYRVPPREG